MIVSFGDAATADRHHGRRTAQVRRFPSAVQVVAIQKLDVLDAAESLQDLLSPPGNRLEALLGDLRGPQGVPQYPGQRPVTDCFPLGLRRRT